jgi:hypothetical protein
VAKRYAPAEVSDLNRIAVSLSAAALAASLLLAACQSSAPTKGRIDDDTYRSPHGNYTMPIPLDADHGRRIMDDARDLQGRRATSRSATTSASCAASST